MIGQSVTTRVDSPLAIIRSAIARLACQRILDVGCGEGGLVRQLDAEGALAVGVDPNPEAIAKAKRDTPSASFETAPAEAVPFADLTFDLVVMLNSLHHVPVLRMDEALREARRVLRNPGTLIIIEPLASGNFFEALRRVEDETEIRHAAQLAIARARPRFARHRTFSYVRRETYDTPGQLIARIIAVDPARQAIVDANSDEIISAIAATAIPTVDGRLAFDQPIKADILSNPV